MTYIKSKKYTGISHRVTATDTIFYCSYKTKAGNYSRFKTGYKSAGMTEKRSFEILQSEKQKILTGDITQLSKKKIITLKQASDWYFKDLELRMTSDYKASKAKFVYHVLPYFGNNRDIKDISSEQIHEYKIFKLKTHAAATTAMHVSMLSSLFNYLKRKRKINIENSAFGIERTIPLDNARERYLNTEEIYQLLDVLKTNYYSNKPPIAKLLLYFVKFALSAGARDNSILNIKRSNIDLKSKTVNSSTPRIKAGIPHI